MPLGAAPLPVAPLPVLLLPAGEPEVEVLPFGVLWAAPSRRCRDEGEGEKRGLKGTAGHDTLDFPRAGPSRHAPDNSPGTVAVPGRGLHRQGGGAGGFVQRAAIVLGRNPADFG